MGIMGSAFFTGAANAYGRAMSDAEERADKAVKDHRADIKNSVRVAERSYAQWKIEQAKVEGVSKLILANDDLTDVHRGDPMVALALAKDFRLKVLSGSRSKKDLNPFLTSLGNKFRADPEDMAARIESMTNAYEATIASKVTAESSRDDSTWSKIGQALSPTARGQARQDALTQKATAGMSPQLAKFYREGAGADTSSVPEEALPSFPIAISSSRQVDTFNDIVAGVVLEGNKTASNAEHIQAATKLLNTLRNNPSVINEENYSDQPHISAIINGMASLSKNGKLPSSLTEEQLNKIGRDGILSLLESLKPLEASNSSAGSASSPITATQWKGAAKTQKKIPGAKKTQRLVGGVWYTMVPDGSKYKYVKVAP